MFTSHPITGEPLTIIEGSWGLGEAVVSGSVSPDKYVFDQRSEKVVDTLDLEQEGRDHRRRGPWHEDWWTSRSRARMHRSSRTTRWQNSPCTARSPRTTTAYRRTSNGVSLAATSISSSPGRSRRSGRPRTRAAEARQKHGRGEDPGPGDRGSARYRLRQGRHHPDVKEIGLVKEGDILVTRMTNPDMVPAMRKVAAIVTDEGGMTCHAAIVSPGTGHPGRGRHADSNEGPEERAAGHGRRREGASSTRGRSQHRRRSEGGSRAVASRSAMAPIITATSVKVNVSIPEAAARAAATGADGVGLLRIEHLILGLNKTPGWFIKNERRRSSSRSSTTGSRSCSTRSRERPSGCGRSMRRPTSSGT